MQIDGKDKARRCVAIRTMLNLWTIFNAASVPPETLLVKIAVRLGEYEGRPLDVSALAVIIGQPRSTTLRHVRALELKGLVDVEKQGRRKLLRDREEPSDEAERFYRAALDHIRNAARELTILDS